MMRCVVCGQQYDPMMDKHDHLSEWQTLTAFGGSQQPAFDEAADRVEFEAWYLSQYQNSSKLARTPERYASITVNDLYAGWLAAARKYGAKRSNRE